MTYFFESNIALIILYLVYTTIKRNYFLHINRYLILVILLFSVIIPLLNFELSPNFNSSSNIDNLSEINQGINSPINTINTNPNSFESRKVDNFFNYGYIRTSLLIIYLVGCVIFFLKYCKNLYYLIRLISSSTKVKVGTITYVLLENNKIPFSFLNYIFIDKPDFQKDSLDDDIINHEISHVRHLHSIDIILIEFVKILYWFNPIIAFYKYSLKAIHEYEADQDVVNGKQSPEDYQQKLIEIVLTNNMSLICGFNNTLTKNRIKMLSNFKLSGLKLIPYLVLIPLFAFLLISFNTPYEVKDSNISSSIPVTQSKIDKKAGWFIEMNPIITIGSILNRYQSLTYPQGELLSKKELKKAPNYHSIEKALKNPDEVYKLYLNYKSYTEVPSEIGQFKNLQELGLGENKLTTLSPEIFQLKNLQLLELSHNNIKVLPAEISKLINLEKILYWNNGITTLPEEIGKLKDLKELQLNKNPISDSEKAKIKKLLPNTKITF